MTIELRPLGVKCNLHCSYCYQNPQRDAGNVARSYDLEEIRLALEREAKPFSLFGGEALLIPKKDLKKLWSWGLERYGRNGIQTNGILIDDEHISLFKQYQVGVGISIDGPGELNDLRWAGTLDRTRQTTAKTEKAIEKLCQEGLAPGLIVTLHRVNATQDKLPIMNEWFKYLEQLGITSARLHILEVENEFIQHEYALSTEENIQAFLNFEQLEKELITLKFDIFQDMRNMLLGKDEYSTCNWNACDPYTTRAVRGIEGNGQSSNCGRTNKDGIDFTKSDIEGFERYLALYYTPQQYGGCKDCRFFLMCKGDCPGTAMDGDWRNRTRDCEVWQALYQTFEQELLKQGLNPISLSSDRKQLEKIILDGWIEGRNINIARALLLFEQGLNRAIMDYKNTPKHVPHQDTFAVY
ncbi:radical SAM protein [Geitlerinema sp. PCC 7407]|uniref:radical SAM protein n=1 Tax=Geitlerinema sp. PCC 7407 TaxID=1173025 RepID=UPI00029FA56E|nr:radical SAM protein [Geitlerinema sp. PCC 7407]AFY67270.1 Radical SAM domain protein [Geitlerinema sp. PCC 7407]